MVRQECWERMAGWPFICCRFLKEADRPHIRIRARHPRPCRLWCAFGGCQVVRERLAPELPGRFPIAALIRRNAKKMGRRRVATVNGFLDSEQDTRQKMEKNGNN